MLCLVLRLPRVCVWGVLPYETGVFRGAKGRNVVLPILSLGLWVNKHTM